MKSLHQTVATPFRTSAVGLLRTGILLGCLANTGGLPSVSGQSTEQQLKVVEHTWGFDGRVQPGQFNPLSILLDNQTDDPIDATATLQRIQGMLNPTGGQYAQQVFIAPTARRWIQFYPYIPDGQQTDWRLELNGKKVADFTQPRPAWTPDADQKKAGGQAGERPQVVILDRANRMTTQPPALRHLPENVFPPYSTVTFGLHTVFLDHVPDWELPRQEAFMSWLKRGGRLHLLKDSRNEFPQFSGAMLDLNQPLDNFMIGYGNVSRHAIQRNQVTEDLVRRSVTVTLLKGEDEELDELIKQQQQQYGDGLSQFIETEPSTIDETFFREMRKLTLPEHAWWLIFLLAVCYIGLIFPGCFLLSKRNNLHFLTTYGAIVGLSLVFSMLFLMIGRRGYGETTNLQTLGVARAEDDTHWSVFEWNALFVTSGDNYSAAAENQQAVLATGDTVDRSDAQIVSGNNAQIAMRIPPFSSQTFVGRRRLTGTDWQLKILEQDIQPSGLVRLVIQTGPGFPADQVRRSLVLIGRRIYEMRFDSTKRTLTLFGNKRSLAEFCQPVPNYDYMNPWNQPQQKEVKDIVDKFYEESLPSLMRRSLIDDLVHNPTRFELPADRIRLFVYAEIPEEFSMSLSAEAKNTGRILFTKDIYLQN